MSVKMSDTEGEVWPFGLRKTAEERAEISAAVPPFPNTDRPTRISH